jgi:rod shape-determining protein MreC
MINDQSSGVGALLEKSRLQGVVRGTANGELSLDHVMSDEQVSPGETVLSSGGDQIFPKGLPIGTVTHVSPGKEMFLNIKVKPAADLSRIEEVLVVIEKKEEQPVARGAVKVRAADILAQRLPSVPEKPATVTNAVPAVPAVPGTKNPNAASTEKPLANAVLKPVTGSTAKPAVSSAINNATAASANSGNSSVKSAAAQAKPATPQPLAQSPENQDSPH